MRNLRLFLLTVAACFAIAASAGETFHLKDGRVIRDVTKVRTDGVYIYLTVSYGIEKIDMKYLSPEDQKRYKYDEDKAAAVRKAEEAEAAREADARRVKGQVERSKVAVAGTVMQVTDDGFLLIVTTVNGREQRGEFLVYVVGSNYRIRETNDWAGTVYRIGEYKYMTEDHRISSVNRVTPSEVIARDYFLGNATPGDKVEQRDADEDMPIDEGQMVTGTGWISEYGVIVTNFHVVARARKITIKLGGKDYVSKVLSTDEDHDIAILQLPPELKGVKGLPVAGYDVKLGSELYVLGFPLLGILDAKAKFTSGVASTTLTRTEEGYMFQMSVPIQSGNSGGPVMNRSGHVVGIATAKLNSSYVMAATGNGAENVNFAVSHWRLLEHFRQKSYNLIRNREADVADQLAPDQVAALLLPATVLIIVQ